MRSLYLALIFLFLSTLSLCAQGKLGLPDSIDFGSVRPGSVRDTVIELINGTGATITLTSMGFTGADSSQFSHDLSRGRTIQPQGRDSITIMFRPSRPGNVSVGLGISQDGITTHMVMLRGTAPRLSIVPDPLVIGPVIPGQCDTIVAQITNHAGSRVFPLSITTSTSDSIMSVVDFSRQIDTTGTVIIVFCPPDTGTYTTNLIVTDSGSSQPLGSVRANARYPFRISPASIDFGGVQSDTCRQRSVLVTNTWGADLNLSVGFLRATQGLTLLTPTDVPLRAGTSQSVTVEYCGVIYDTIANSLVVTVVGTGAQHSGFVPITGRGLPWAFPDTIDFGTIPVGDSLQRGIVLVNADSLNPLSVTLALDTNFLPHRSKDFFIVDSTGNARTALPLFINARGNSMVQLLFKPLDSGCVTGQISIVSGSDTGRVFLRGCSVNGGGGSDSIEIKPSSTFSFGDVMVGYCKDLPFTVTNNRSDTLWLEHSIANPVFQIVTPPSEFFIPPGQTRPVMVRFCPTDTVSFTSADLISDLRSQIQLRVDLWGTGVIWSLPDSIAIGPVDLSAGDTCARATITVVNNSSWPIKPPTLGLEPSSNNFTLVTGLDTSDVDPDRSFDITVEFCLHDSTSVTVANLLLTTPDKVTRGDVVVRGTWTGTAQPEGPVLTVDSTELDFGPVDVGTSKRDTFYVRNHSSRPVTLGANLPQTGVDFRPVQPSSTQPITIGPDAIFPVIIDFVPTTSGYSEYLWRGNDSSSLTVLLKGTGAQREGRIVWLDTTGGDVGDPIPMRLRVSPMLLSNEGVDTIRFVITFNPTSLFLRNIVPLTRSTTKPAITRTVLNDSSIAIEMISTREPITGDSLLLIEFTGYTTGEPKNIVTLHRDSVSGFGPLFSTGPGLLLLEGCDLGRGITGSRKVRINSIVSDMGSSEVTIRYRAPHGVLPSLRLVDMNGQRVMEHTLAEGTEAEQDAAISLAGYAPGIYLIELRAGSDRSVTMIMIGR